MKALHWSLPIHFWDAAGGALIGSVLGVAGSLFVAWLVYRWTRKNQAKELDRQLTAQAEQAAALLENQKQANRELVAVTADHNRSLAAQTASLEAAKTIGTAFHSMPGRLYGLALARDIVTRRSARTTILEEIGGVMQAERPSILDPDLRLRIEDAYVSMIAFFDWCFEAENTVIRWRRDHEASASIYPPSIRDSDTERAASQKLGEYFAYVLDCLGRHRLNDPLPARIRPLVQDSFGAYPNGDQTIQ